MLLALIGCAPTAPEDTGTPIDPAAFDDDCGHVLPLAAGTAWTWLQPAGEDDLVAFTDAVVADGAEVDGVPVFEVLAEVYVGEGEPDPEPATSWRHRFRCNAGDVWLLETRGCAPDGWATVVRYEPGYRMWSDAGFDSEAGWSIAATETWYEAEADPECLGAADGLIVRYAHEYAVTLGWYEALLVEGEDVVGRELLLGDELLGVVAEGWPFLQVRNFPVYDPPAARPFYLDRF